MTYEATHSATSSPESADGARPCTSLAGPMTDLFGQALAHASPSAPQASGVAATMSATYGLPLLDLFGHAVHQSFSESRSQVEQDSSGLMVKVRTCRTCKTEQPYSEYYVNSKGGRRNSCKTCVQAAERLRKRSEPEAVSDRYKAWRLEKRGFALVNVAKNRAKTKGLPFNLDPQEVQKVIDSGKCQVTGIEFDLTEPRAWNAPSLDQIVPGAGYTKANVRVVLYALNVMANTWGHSKITQIASAILGQRKSRSERLTSLIGERLKSATTMQGSPVFAFSWKSVATPSGRQICALRARALSTSDNGSTGWPTPNAGPQNDGDTTWQARREAMKAKHGNGNGFGMNLGQAVTLTGWPTPKTSDMKGNCYETTETRRSELRKSAFLCGWQTPQSRDHKGANLPGNELTHNSRPPNEQVRLAAWATPVVRDHKNSCGDGSNPRDLPRQVRLTYGPTSNGSSAATEKPGQLNPAFSRWLQGYRKEWCEAAIAASRLMPTRRRKPE